MWMTTVILSAGHLMVQGARASARDEVVPVRKARGFAPCGERGCLPLESRSGTKGKCLPGEAAPVDLARYSRAVSEALGDLAVGSASRKEWRRMVETVLHV